MYLLVTVILNLVVLVLSTILLADFRAWKRGGAYSLGYTVSLKPLVQFHRPFLLRLDSSLTCFGLGTGGTSPTILGYLKILRWGLYLALHPEDLLDASGLPNTGPSYLRADLINKRYGHPPVLTKW